MPHRLSRSLAVVLSLPSLALAKGPLELLPTTAPVGISLDVAQCVEHFPEVLEAKTLKKILTDLKDLGIENPSQNISSVVFGLRLGGPEGVLEGVTLGSGSEPVREAFVAAAEARGETPSSRAVRGVTLSRAPFQSEIYEAADGPDGVFFLTNAKNSASAYGDRVVGHLVGQSSNQASKLGLAFGGRKLLRFGLEVTSQVLRDVAGTELEDLKHLRGADGGLDRSANGVKLDAKIVAKGRIQAMVLERRIRSEIQNLAPGVSDPVAREVLLRTQVSRSGANVKLKNQASKEEVPALIRAIDELVPALFEGVLDGLHDELTSRS